MADRGRCAQPSSRLGQRVEPPQDDLLHALGHAHLIERLRGHRPRASAVGERPQRLLDEERVAARLLPQLGDQIGLRRVDPRLTSASVSCW